MRIVVRTVATVVLSLTAVGGARADIPPENSQGCRGAKVGESCKTDDGNAGGCVASRCSTARGSDYDCLLCDAAAAPAPKSGCVAGEGGALGLAALALFALRRPLTPPPARTRRPR